MRRSYEDFNRILQPHGEYPSCGGSTGEGGAGGSLLARVEDMPSADGFDVVFAGYWLDRGGPDAKAKEFLHSLHGKHVVLFETMGADPRSEHAYTGFANAGTALSPDNQIVGVFAVQGLSILHCWR